MSVRRAFLALSACSGATVLIYQAVWTRLLTLSLGHTAPSRATIYVAFLGGLALGARLTARRAATIAPRTALAQSAFLELLIALLALIIWPALTLAQPVLASVYQDGDGGALFFGTRGVLCLALIALPAIAMGATFAWRVRWFESVDTSTRQSAGTIYATHLIGGAIGAAVAAILLIPFAGLSRTTVSTVMVNVILAAGFLWLRQIATTPLAAPEGDGPPVIDIDTSGATQRGKATNGNGNYDGSHTGSYSRPRPTSAAIAIALSGCITLLYAVAWTRLLALTLGPTSFVESVTGIVFVLGLALGALLASHIVSRVSRPILALAVTQMIAALSAFIIARSVPTLPGLIVSFLRQPHPYAMVLGMQAIITAMLVLPMAIALGATFPFGVATAEPEWRQSSTASAGARILAASLAGMIAGFLAATFVFVPQFGLQRTMLLGGLIGSFSGIELTWRSRKRDHIRIWLTTAGVLTAILGLTLRPWSPKVLTGGPYRFGGLSPSELQVELDAGNMLFARDGTEGTVAVKRVAGNLTLSIDGAIAGTNASSMLLDKLLAHVPLLLHTSPADVCLLGLGNGVAAGAALTHHIARLDTIEPSVDVVNAAAQFAKENHQALSDARTHVIVGDARAHLRLARRSYDVILSAPPNPWTDGAAPLVTRELFEAARDRLNAGGLFAHWLHAGYASQPEVQSIVATFADVFPDTSVWLVGDRDLLLVGGRDPILPRLGNVASGWLRPGVAKDLAEVDVRDPFSVLSLLAAEGDAVTTLADNNVERQSDDRPAVELSAPRGLYSPGERSRWLAESPAIKKAQPDAIAQTEAAAGASPWRNRAVMLLRADAPEPAYDAAARALALDPIDREALTTLSRASTLLGRQKEALKLLEGLVARTPTDQAPLVALSRLRALAGQTDQAVAAASEATQQFPDRFGGWDQLASILVRKGDAATLAATIDQMRTAFGERWETSYYEGMLHLLRGEYAAAARVSDDILEQHPAEPRVLNLAGSAYAALGVRDKAREAFEASLSSEPRDPMTYVTLGRFELDTFNPQRAAALFTEALFLDPRSPAALNGLADALSRMGRAERAAELRARAGTF